MKRFGYILTVSIVLMLVLAPPLPDNSIAKDQQAQTTGVEWQRYKIDGDFSVFLPFIPATSTIHATYARNQTRRERTIAAYADGVVFVILTFEKKGMSFDDLVQRNGEDGTAETVTTDGLKGKSYSGSSETTVWTAQFFDAGDNLYKFAATASKLGDHSAALSKFFSSISFANNQQGSAILDGPGEQSRTHANAAKLDAIVKSSELTTRARVVSKPEPMYTEQARMNQTTGTVVLRCIFSRSGAVENISVIKDLPNGLTDSAVAAARQIRFIPGVKDGQFVSTWIQLEYNFNLY